MAVERLSTARPMKLFTRAKWARWRRRPLFGDEDIDWSGLSGRVADYATADEIAAWIAALEAEWRNRTPALRAATRGEGTHHPGQLREQRRQLRVARQILQAGRCPDHGEWRREPVSSILASLVARYEAAQQAYIEAKTRERAETPIDDAAWAAELARRRQIAHEIQNDRRYVPLVMQDAYAPYLDPTFTPDDHPEGDADHEPGLAH